MSEPEPELNPWESQWLLPAEKTGLTVARAITGRGDDLPPNMTRMLLMTIERLVLALANTP